MTSERKYTAPIGGEKRYNQLLKTALKLARKGPVGPTAIAAEHDVSAPLVAAYLGRGEELEKTIRSEAKKQGVKLHADFSVPARAHPKPKRKVAEKPKRKVAEKPKRNVAEKPKPARKRSVKEVKAIQRKALPTTAAPNLSATI